MPMGRERASEGAGAGQKAVVIEKDATRTDAVTRILGGCLRSWIR